MRKFTVRDILSETNADKLNYRYCVSISKNGDGTSKIVWKHAKISETGLSIHTEDVIIPLVLGIICIENSFADDIRYYLDNEVLKDRSGAYYYYRALPIY